MKFRNKFFTLMEEAVDGTGQSATAGSEDSFLPEGNTPEPAEDSTESNVNWGEVAGELEKDDAGEGEVTEGDEEVVKEEPQAPAKPAEPAPAVTTPPVDPTAAVPPTPATPSVDSQPITPEPVVAPVQAADYSAWRATRLTELESVYALDEASANALLTEPETVLPKLAAKVHMEVMENSMRAVQAMIPVMMQEIQQSTEVETRAKSLFTSINPDLADPSYTPAILQFGKVFRNVNPTASPEEASRAIGALVRAALNITGAPAQPAAPAPTAATPAVPVPFTPARGGGGVAGRVVQSDNEFTRLAEEFLLDE